MPAKKQKQLVNFILDESGSMGSVEETTISAFNEYVDTLKKENGDILFTLTMFNSKARQVYKEKPVKEVEHIDASTYQPNMNTALYDAVCQTLNDLEVDPKTKSLVVILTDGEENSSTEYTQEQFAALVKKLEGKGNWTFVYLGANQNSWLNAQKWGFSPQNVVDFKASQAGVRSAMNMTAQATVSHFSTQGLNSKSFYSAEAKSKIENEEL